MHMNSVISLDAFFVCIVSTHFCFREFHATLKIVKVYNEEKGLKHDPLGMPQIASLIFDHLHCRIAFYGLGMI